MPKKVNTRRKDGRYAVQIYLGLDESGKRRYKTVYGATQKEANKKAEQVRIMLGKGIDVSAERDSFKEWGERWLDLKRQEVSVGRYNTYKYEFEKLSPIFQIEIGKMRTADIQNVILALARKSPVTGKPCARSTLKDIKSVAVQICRMAVENRVMDYNPVLSVKIPDVPKNIERRALTDEEQQWIVHTPHRAQPAAMIMMYAGLRRGELIPLTWEDIDLKNATIDVNKTVEIINGKAVVKNTAKTKSSIRTVDIPNVLVTYLKTVIPVSKYVVPAANGDMLSETAYKRMWESYLSVLNEKYGDFSDLPQKKSRFSPGGVTDADSQNYRALVASHLCHNAIFCGSGYFDRQGAAWTY